MEKLSYSIEQAAEATGYSQTVIRRALTRGDLSARYANRKPVILASELQDWLTSLPSEAPTR